MRRLVLLVLLASGCVVNSSSTGSATVEVTWDFAIDGQFSNVCGDVSMVAIEVNGVISTVACDAPAQDFAVSPGTTAITVTALNSDGATLGFSQQDSVTLVDGDLATVNVDVDLGSTMAATWTIFQSTNAATCADVGASLFQVVSIDARGNKTLDVFNCTDGSGTTSPIQAGDYTVHGELLDASNQTISSTQPTSVTVTDGQQLVLPTFVFQL